MKSVRLLMKVRMELRALLCVLRVLLSTLLMVVMERRLVVKVSVVSPVVLGVLCSSRQVRSVVLM